MSQLRTIERRKDEANGRVAEYVERRLRAASIWTADLYMACNVGATNRFQARSYDNNEAPKQISTMARLEVGVLRRSAPEEDGKDSVGDVYILYRTA